MITAMLCYPCGSTGPLLVGYEKQKLNVQPVFESKCKTHQSTLNFLKKIKSINIIWAISKKKKKNIKWATRK